MSKTASKPVAKINDTFPVTGSIWRQERDGKVYYSASFQRAYRSESGKWKHSDSFNHRDLLLLAKAADLAETEISKLRAADRQEQSPEEDAQPADE